MSERGFVDLEGVHGAIDLFYYSTLNSTWIFGICSSIDLVSVNTSEFRRPIHHCCSARLHRACSQNHVGFLQCV